MTTEIQKLMRIADLEAETNKMRYAIDSMRKDEANTDTAIRDAARKVLPAFDVDGDSYGVPSIEDIVESLVAEIARLRLTDAEREAVDRQAKWLVNQAKHKPDIHSADLLLQEAATLRGLLERLK